MVHAETLRVGDRLLLFVCQGLEDYTGHLKDPKCLDGMLPHKMAFDFLACVGNLGVRVKTNQMQSIIFSILVRTSDTNAY